MTWVETILIAVTLTFVLLVSFLHLATNASRNDIAPAPRTGSAYRRNRQMTRPKAPLVPPTPLKLPSTTAASARVDWRALTVYDRTEWCAPVACVRDASGNYTYRDADDRAVGTVRASLLAATASTSRRTPGDRLCVTGDASVCVVDRRLKAPRFSGTILQHGSKRASRRAAQRYKDCEWVATLHVYALDLTTPLGALRLSDGVEDREEFPLFIAPCYVAVVARFRHVAVYELPTLRPVLAEVRDVYAFVWHNTLVLCSRFAPHCSVYVDGPTRPPTRIDRQMTSIYMSPRHAYTDDTLGFVAAGLCYTARTVAQLLDPTAWQASVPPVRDPSYSGVGHRAACADTSAMRHWYANDLASRSTRGRYIFDACETRLLPPLCSLVVDCLVGIPVAPTATAAPSPATTR